MGAQDIYARAADALAEIVAATARRLGVAAQTRVPVSTSGGVFERSPLLRDAFKAAVARHLPAARLVRPRYAPAIGAALKAARLSGRPLDDTALQRLDTTP